MKANHSETGISLSRQSSEQVKNDLNQVGTDMQTILRLLEEMSSEGNFNHHCSAIELLTMRSGALSDRIAKSIDGIQIAGDLNEWFGFSD